MPPKKGQRVAAIEKHFGPPEQADAQILYACVVEGCREKVRCAEGRGAPGRLSHLKNSHKDIFEALPKPRERQQADPTQEAAAHAQEHDRKRQRNCDDAIDFLARNLLPFSLSEDTFVRREGLNRNNVAEKMADRLRRLKETFVLSAQGGFYSIAVDSGTNAGMRTLNATLLHRNVSRTVLAERVKEQTAENIVEAISKVVEMAKGLRVSAFVSDNAANVKLACVLLAQKYHALSSSCGCHAINTVVKRICYTWADIDRARKICDKARDADKSIPVEIDSRWNSAFLAFEAVVKNGPKLVYNNVLSRQEVEGVAEAKALLEPYFFASKSLERDCATIFDSIKAKATCFVTAESDDLFQEIFGRNCYSTTLVAACAVSPMLASDSLIKPLQLMIEECIRDCLYNLNNDFSDKTADQEIKILLEGHIQRLHRLKTCEEALAKVWQRGDTPLIGELVDFLVRVPASSATVERAFSPHARCHTWVRNSLSEESVISQLALHSFLSKQNESGTEPAVTSPTQAEAERILNWCFPEWAKIRTEKLKENDMVVVWYENASGAKGTGRLQPYRCKLLEQVGDAWKVKWNNDPGSQQRFKPNVDPWVWLSEQ
jgi:hypothetical protein